MTNIPRLHQSQQQRRKLSKRDNKIYSVLCFSTAAILISIVVLIPRSMNNSSSSFSAPADAGATDAVTTDTAAAYTGSGLSPTEFDSILDMESKNELSHLSSSDAIKIWMDSTEKIWQTKNTNDENTASTSFIICNSTPNLSGNRRKKQVTAMFSSAVASYETENEDEKDTILGWLDNTEAVYNGDDKSCILLTSPIGIAQQVLDASPPSIKIQPLLPMTKLSSGTMKAIKARTSSSYGSTHSSIRIKAILNRNLLSHKENHSANDIWEEIQAESNDTDALRKCVLETFPTSGPILVNSQQGHQEQRGQCTDLEGTDRMLGPDDNTDPDCSVYKQIIMTSNQNEGEDEGYDDFEDPSMTIDIFLRPNPDKGITHTKKVDEWDVVSIVSSLACRSEVTSIDIVDDIVLY